MRRPDFSIDPSVTQRSSRPIVDHDPEDAGASAMAAVIIPKAKEILLKTFIGNAPQR
jgi:hypothetical protein